MGGVRLFRRRRNEAGLCERHARRYRLHRAPPALFPLLRVAPLAQAPFYHPCLSRPAPPPSSGVRAVAFYYAYRYAYVPC